MKATRQTTSTDRISKSNLSTAPASPEPQETAEEPESLCLPRQIETELLTQGYDIVIGVDEAGRGPLAGPVVAAACAYLVNDALIPGVNDSKQVNEAGRESLYEQMKDLPKLYWSAKEVDNQRIDEINILQATFEAMSLAVEEVLDRLRSEVQTDFKFHVLIDGNKVPPQLKKYDCTPVIKGDSKEFIIASASIFAKVTRDRIMEDLHIKYPMYNFKQHKGYPTGDHCSAIFKHGPCPYHRMTFAPLKHIKPKSESATESTKSGKVTSVKSAGKKRSSEVIEEGSVMLSEGNMTVRRSSRLRITA